MVCQTIPATGCLPMKPSRTMLFLREGPPLKPLRCSDAPAFGSSCTVMRRLRLSSLRLRLQYGGTFYASSGFRAVGSKCREDPAVHYVFLFQPAAHGS